MKIELKFFLVFQVYKSYFLFGSFVFPLMKTFAIGVLAILESANLVDFSSRD